MKTEPSVRTGRIVARDLMTKDVDRSRELYAELLGLEGRDLDQGEMGIWGELGAGDETVARLVPLDASVPIDSHWVIYVSVEDVDAACDRASGAGGNVCYEPFDAPGFGRFALIDDGSKALTKPLVSEDGDPSFDASLGRFVWDELLTSDLEGAARFYEALYDWQLFRCDDSHGIFTLDGEGTASVARALDGASGWVPHARVESVEAALENATRLGAQVVRGVQEIPRVGKSAIVRDPQGALFGLISIVPSGKKPPARRSVKKAPKPAKPKLAPSTATAPPSEIFARTAERFVPQEARELEAVVQYDLDGEGGGVWHLVFDKGTCTVHEGRHAAPTLELKLSGKDYAEIAFGRSTGPLTVAAGKMEMTGDVNLAFRLGRILKPLR